MIDVTFPPSTTKTREYYGCNLPTSLPLEEMNALSDIDLMIGFYANKVPQDLIPTKIEMTFTNGLTAPIRWQSIDIDKQDNVISYIMRDLTFGGYGITFLSAYIAATQTQRLLFEAARTYEPDFDFKVAEEGMKQVAHAILTSGNYYVALHDLTNISCFLL